MIALKLVRLIENHSEQLAQSLLHRVENSPKCSELRLVPRRELEIRVFDVYQHMTEWLLNKTDHDMERTYVALGKRRFEQGVSFQHFYWGIMLTKENLWDFLERQVLEQSALYLHGEFELLRLLDQFFDRAVYYAAQGYAEAQPATHFLAYAHHR